MKALSPRIRILLTLFSIAIFAVIALTVPQRYLAVITVAALLPVTVAAAMYGMWAGLIAALLLWPLQDFLLSGLRPSQVDWAHIHMDWPLHSVFIAVGIVIGYLSSLTRRLQREIAERQVVQVELEKQVRYNQLLLNTTLDGYILADTDGNILEVNPAYCAMTGYTAEELRQLNICDIEALFSDEEVAEHIAHMVSHGTGRFHTRHYRKDGQVIDLDVSVAIVQPDGKPLVAAFVRDISEQLQAQRQLQQYTEDLEAMVAERTRSLQEAQDQLLQQERLAVVGQLAEGISQELRNPLSVIANAAYYLKLVQPDAGSTIHEYLDLINEEVQIATRILTELHYFANAPLQNRNQVAVSWLISEAFTHHPPPAHIQIHQEIPDDLPLAFVDPEHALRALSEVLHNAYDAMPDGGELHITATVDEDESPPMLRLSIRDSGEGLTPPVINRAFEPLFSTKSRGLGLGLTLARTLLQANDARIDITGAPDQGATVTIWLPVAESSQE